MAIIIAYHGVELVMGYCRNALYYKWGRYCGNVFLRESDHTLSRSWALALKRGLFFFKPTRLKLVTLASPQV